jgi:hypothetical protein
MPRFCALRRKSTTGIAEDLVGPSLECCFHGKVMPTHQAVTEHDASIFDESREAAATFFIRQDATLVRTFLEFWKHPYTSLSTSTRHEAASSPAILSITPTS